MLPIWKRMRHQTRAALTAGALIISALALTYLFAKWFDGSEAGAAWVQAGGTLVALVAAVSAIEYELAIRKDKEEHEQRSKTQSLLVMVHPQLLDLIRTLEELVDELSRTGRQLAELENGSMVIDPNGYRLGIPAFFQDTWSDFHLFDLETLKAVNQLLASISCYGGKLSTTIRSKQTVNRNTTVSAQRDIDGLRWLAIRSRDNAKRARQRIETLLMDIL